MEVVLDHLENNAESAVPADNEQDAQPASIKCDECGKLFKDNALAGYHAEKSGHASFSQSTEQLKPLTEEEKAERLKELKAKMDEKRKAQAEASKEDDKRNEIIRQQRGKEEQAIREDMKAKELKKDLEKKKKEKEEDRKAMLRVKQQIEADKKERAEKAAKEKALREGKLDNATPAQPAKPALPRVSASNATETRLQLRTPNGTLTTTQKVESTLTDLSDFVATQQMVEPSSLSFATTFPARTFTADEMHFYQPIRGRDEDIINQNTVQNGYTAPPAVQNETFSCNQLIIDSLQSNQVASNLELIFKSALDKRHTRNHPQSNYIKDLDAADANLYFKQLACTNIPLQNLLKLPRNLTPSVILHQLQLNQVDPRRSIWFIKLISKPSSENKQLSFNLSMDWTRVLTGQLSDKLIELPTPEGILDNFDSKLWLSQFTYILDILRAFIVNGLLDNLTLHIWLLDHLKHIHMARLPLVTTLVLENMQGFYSSHQLTNGLVDAACCRLGQFKRTIAGENLTSLRSSLERIIINVFTCFPCSFVSPKLWINHGSLFESLIGTQPHYQAIQKRNHQMLYGNTDKSLSSTPYSSRQSLVRDITLLDTINTNTNIRAYTLSYFQVDDKLPKRTIDEKITTMLDWASTENRNSQHRCYAVATILRFYISLQLKQKLSSKNVIKRHLQELIFSWIEVTSSDRKQEDVPKLIGELVRRRVFSYSSYLQHIIATGLMSNTKKSAIHKNILRDTPLFDASLSIVNLRRMSIDKQLNADDEKSLDSLIRTFRALLPRLYKNTENIPLITTLDLDNSFRAFKKLPLFYRYRCIQSNLLPSVYAFIDTKTSESKMSIDEVATVISILEYFEDFASLQSLLMELIPKISERQVLFLLMDTIRRNWTTLVCLNGMDKLIKCVTDKYYAFNSSGGHVRPLLLLLVTAKNTSQLPHQLLPFVNDAAAALNRSLRTSMSPSPPPSRISDVQKLLYDSTISNAADLATTLWFRHSSYTQWGSSAWMGVLDALKVKHDNTPQLVSCFSTFLHEVNNRFPDGLEKHITESLVKHPETLLSGELSEVMKSILVQMVVRRVVQTTSIIEDVYLPLISQSPSDEVVLNLNDVLLSILTPEKKSPMILRDYQHLMTRRGKAYRPPYLGKLAEILPVLVNYEVSDDVSETVKSSCRFLRESISSQSAFSTACMRDLDNVYEVMMSASKTNIQELIIDTLKQLISFSNDDMEHDDKFAIHHANPWTISRHKIVLHLVLNYNSCENKRCHTTVSDLLSQMDNNTLVLDMLRGISGNAGQEFANIKFSSIMTLLASLKDLIDGDKADDELRCSSEIYGNVEMVSQVLLHKKVTLPLIDSDILTQMIKNLNLCFQSIFLPGDETLENGEVVEENEDTKMTESISHSRTLEVLYMLIQVLLRVPESLTASISDIGNRILPHLLRQLTRSDDGQFEKLYDTIIALVERIPGNSTQDAFNVVDPSGTDLPIEIRRVLPLTQSMRIQTKFSSWDLLDQIPETNDSKRVQFNAPQLHKWLDAQLVNDRLLDANSQIEFEYERNIPGDGLEAGPVLAYQFKRSLRNQDLGMTTEPPVDDVGINLKKRKVDEENGSNGNGIALTPASNLTTMKSKLWQLGRQLKLAKFARSNPTKSLKGLINPFKAALASPTRVLQSTARQAPRTIHRSAFHPFDQSLLVKSSTRPAFGNFANRTSQAGLGSARTFATGRGAIDVMQNVNVFARCALNQLGEHKLSALQSSSLKRNRKQKNESFERLQDFKDYFVVPEFKTVLAAPISASLSHLLTDKPKGSECGEYALFDEEFVKDLINLKVSSKVHSKRLDVLCASVKPIADTLEITNIPGNDLLILKATFDGITPKEVEAIIQKRLASYSLDEINNAHLMAGWYRLYQVNEDVVLHDIVSQSFCLPDPASSLESSWA
ncbi:hypothetical protein E3Q12_04056 [Wallemia mellicola]|nr:hypothetical protein E3Q12_04056 [Wallemia mellicola]